MAIIYWNSGNKTTYLLHFYRELDNVLDALKKSANNSWSSPDSVLQSSVINLDDSYGLPSPSERNVVVKVRTRSGIRRFTMKAVSIMLPCVYDPLVYIVWTCL